MRTSRLIATCLRRSPACRTHTRSVLACPTPSHLAPLPRTFSSTTSTLSNVSTSSLFNPPNETKPFFVTTPIFYVNASPHIGHLHSLVLADVLARYAKLRRPDRGVIFTTGTDEHGMKIQQAAAKQGLPEAEFCARVSERFKDLADKANVAYTDFIRTSEERHYKAVKHFWQRLVDSGDVFKDKHGGWYSVSDECFYARTQVKKDELTGEMIAWETGNVVTWEEEQNWKFNLPKYRQALLQWTDSPESVYPEAIRKHVISQIETAEHLSISRPKDRVQWGVPVPGDDTQTIYVWVDALINYLTVLGYPETEYGWPADVHVVGKDIVKFHAIHWPALLMAAQHQPPRRVLSHAHWTMGKYKMSKSRGNVVDPISAIDLYGPDVVRWYLMRMGGAMPTDADQLSVEHQALMSGLGNLLHRITAPGMLNKLKGETGQRAAHYEPLDARLSSVRNEVEKRMEEFQITRACEEVMGLLAAVSAFGPSLYGYKADDQANRMFTQTEPWQLKEAATPIAYAYDVLRIAGILLQPVLPAKATELLDRLGVPADKRTWADAAWSNGANMDAAALREQLSAASREWKGKGYLFPRIEPAKAEDSTKKRAVHKARGMAERFSA